MALAASSSQPLFMQIVRAITGDIRRGRLTAGALLPGSRTLARTLGVHRNTVLAAYRELEAQGCITSAGRATRISTEIPARAAGSASSAGTVGFPLHPAPRFRRFSAAATPGVLHFGGGFPDLRLFPRAELARAYRRALHGSALAYGGDPRGDPALRRMLALLLGEARGLARTEEEILVTTGSQRALDLVARTLIRPGDVVAVEDPGYPPAWSAFVAAGAALVPIPVDGEGVRVEALAELASRRRVRAVYVTPHHQFPTTVTLSAARRLRLLDLACAHRFAIIEDDYDFEFHYDRRPVLPLASSDDLGMVVYLGTFSKLLGPGLRLGWVAAPRPLVDRLAALRAASDTVGHHVLERAVAELIEDGLLARHARRMRRIYQSRRDTLAESLRSVFPAADFETPPGGMSLWLRWPRGVDVEAWSARAPAHGVGFYPGSLFAFRAGRRTRTARLGFTTLDERELREAVTRLRASFDAATRGRGQGDGPPSSLVTCVTSWSTSTTRRGGDESSSTR